MHSIIKKIVILVNPSDNRPQSKVVVTFSPPKVFNKLDDYLKFNKHCISCFTNSLGAVLITLDDKFNCNFFNQ